jgi:hypothetical protein
MSQVGSVGAVVGRALPAEVDDLPEVALVIFETSPSTLSTAWSSV